MRLAIECIERIGVAQEILSLLATQKVNLEGIELNKHAGKGQIYLRTETVSAEQQKQFIQQIEKIAGVIRVSSIHHLPQERKNIELRALLEALPNPVLSLDLKGGIEFANAQACKLLLPVYRQMLPKKQQPNATLTGIALNEIILNLNRTKWYSTFLQQGSRVQNNTLQPVSHPIQFNHQVWRMDLFPIELWEAEQNRLLGYMVALQSQQSMQIDLRQFMANQYSDFDHVVAKSPKMKAVIEQAKKFAMLDAPLLIQGETGTGKDFLAKACHQFSFRRDQKFIAVNCAGLPPQEAESEMFGHRRNGQESVGFFEYANGGTVLLDSVAELSLEMQAKLLRFLNDGSFRRVGEDNEIHVDVRVICTSQKPLATLVAEGKVREDLFHRLNVLTLDLPRLCERQADLPILAEQFLRQVSQQLAINPPQYDEAVINALQTYHWPGNLRELYNVIYRACSLMSNHSLSVEDLHLPQALPTDLTPTDTDSSSLEELVNRFEASLLRKFYTEYPSTRKLAQRLGLSHTAVANKLRFYGISK